MKIFKIFLIVILSLIIAVSGGLLVFGAAFMGDVTGVAMNYGELVAPINPDAYAHGIAEWIDANAEYNYTHQTGVGIGFSETALLSSNPSKNPATFAAEVDGWYDVFGSSDPALSIVNRYSGANQGADLVANLLIPITYNHNRSTQFCMNAYFEVQSGSKKSISDNIRIRVQREPFYWEGIYLGRAWSGSQTNSAATCHMYYNNQQCDTTLGSIIDYDPKEGKWEVQLGPLTKTGKHDGSLDREYPRKVNDLLTLPIYLGDTTVDSSVIDSNSVQLVSPTAEKPYYTLTFSENISSAQASSKNLEYFNGTLGGQMKNIELEKADFTVEIWPCGLFRQVTAHFDFSADIGNSTADMSYKFYFDDKSCDFFSVISSLKWQSNLSKANKADFKIRKAAWAAKYN